VRHGVHSISVPNYIYPLCRSMRGRVSPSSPHHGLKVQLRTRSIMASQCITQFTLMWPQWASLNSLDHGQVVSYLLTHLQCSFSCNRSRLRFLFGCRERRGGMRTVGPLPLSSVISPRWPPSGASLHSLKRVSPCAPPFMLDYHLWPD
jgi:hypothetical protein